MKKPIKTHKKTNTTILLISGFSLLSGISLQAQSTQAFAFGDGIGGPVSLGNGNSFTTGVLTGGGGVVGSGHGNVTSALGGQFNGETGLGTPAGGVGGGVFDSSVNSDGTLSTRINGMDGSGVDGGLATDQIGNIGSSNFLAENFIGFHVQFDDPAEVLNFALLDFDGTNPTREWGTAWGYNSVTNTIVSSTISFANPTQLAIINIDTNLTIDGVSSGFQSLNSTIDGGVVGALPDSISGAFLTSNLGNADPDDFAHQAVFDFAGEEVTDLYFAFGIQGDNPFDGGRNSGLTGFTVTIPEPSSTLLSAFAFCLMSFYRKR